jgi:molybdenum cofactor guanylyltransferase
MLPRMFDVEGFILVGGQSSRMGSDKSRLTFGSRTSVDLIRHALGQLTSKVRMAGGRPQSVHAGIENIPDTHEHWGALGGMQGALAACQTEWAAIVACDLPLVTQTLFARMWSFSDSGKFDAIVPIQPDDRPQPLCAIYRCQPCLPLVNELIAQGEHKPRTLLSRLNVRWVTFPELSDLSGAENFFLNMNTPPDYERARGLLGA